MLQMALTMRKVAGADFLVDEISKNWPNKGTDINLKKISQVKDTLQMYQKHSMKVKHIN